MPKIYLYIITTCLSRMFFGRIYINLSLYSAHIIVQLDSHKYKLTEKNMINMSAIFVYRKRLGIKAEVRTNDDIANHENHVYEILQMF